MTAFGDEIFKTTFEKAAAIAEAIVRHHPFNDGNHRTGLAAAELILEMADMRLVALQEEKLLSIRRLESGALGLDEFAAWLAQNSILKTGLPN